jgi:single-strand DNA-binding protein
MANLNTVILAGRLTRDPEVRHLAGDKTVGSFGLAINRRFKGADGALKEEVTFVDIEVWGRQAEIAEQYLRKGSGVFVDGRLKLDAWEDKDGKKHQRLKVVAESVQFLDRKESSGDAAAPAAGGGTPAHQARNNIGKATPAPGTGGPADDEPPF